jgi:DNA-binding transcriptional MerR regulator
MSAKHLSEKLTIGEFGRQSQLSRKALRLYDERGLLTPAYTDPNTRYRYYTHDQLPIARRIRLLRLMDMPLEKLAVVLAVWETNAQAALKEIHMHLTATEKQLAKVQLAARLLREEIAPIEEKAMAFDFTYQEIPAQMMISIRRHITVPAYHEWITSALQQLRGHITAHGLQTAGDPVALYYGPVNEEDNGPVEIGVPITGIVPPRGEMKIRECPAHRAICVQTYGAYNDYPRVLEVWHAFGKYVEAQGLESNWEHDLTTYEIWRPDRTMSVCWPVYRFPE